MDGEFLSQFSVFWLIGGSQSPEPDINLRGLEAPNPVSFLSPHFVLAHCSSGLMETFWGANGILI